MFDDKQYEMKDDATVETQYQINLHSNPRIISIVRIIDLTKSLTVKGIICKSTAIRCAWLLLLI